MKLYILRWNPNFSMKYQEHLKGMKWLADGTLGHNWSIYDHEDLEAGDAYIFNMVGMGEEDGVAGFGIFSSEPYTQPNWRRKDNTNLFYADLLIKCLLDRKSTQWLAAREMEERFPQINWHSGHSGVLVPAEITEDLLLYLMARLLPLKKPDKIVSFYPEPPEYGLLDFFAYVVPGLCPKFKARIIKAAIEGQYIRYENFAAGEDIDPSLVEIAADEYRPTKFSSPATADELAGFFIPVA